MEQKKVNNIALSKLLRGSNMIIKALTENTSLSEEYSAEHGLSLYIEIGKHKILFDFGETDLFARNAQKLGVDIADVDIAMLSHGHKDHGGGLETFLELNSKALVYAHTKAFEKQYSIKAEGSIKSIGLDSSLLSSNRFVFTADHYNITEGIEVFSFISGKELMSESNNTLFMESGDDKVVDTFEHEHNLIVTENGKSVLFAGCAHNGIVNIMKRYASLKKGYPEYIIGGFHLFNPNTKKSENPGLVKNIALELKSAKSNYYTCHCTGIESYNLLKSVLGDRIGYISAGSILEL